VSFSISAQEIQFDTEIETFLQSNLSELKLRQSDINDYNIYRQYYSKQTGLNHVFLQQNYQGTPIHKAEIRLHWREDIGWVKTQNSFVGNIDTCEIQSSQSLSQVQAIESACTKLGIEYVKPNRLAKKEDNTVLYQSEFSLEPIPVKAEYYFDGIILKRVWNLTIYEKDASACWNVLIDANNGELITKYNWVHQCSFSPELACSHESHSSISLIEAPSSISTGASYNVFAVPLESPAHGSRTIEVDPNDLTASPYGWHDTDGEIGAEFTITRGNNVHAYADLENDNYSLGDEPDGGAELHFDFPFDPMLEPDQNIDAATVNLFYMNNMMHDVWYHYGFDPQAGNFQSNNYGEGGFGNDFVYAQAQDSSGTGTNIALNNANFYTPYDGSSPTMQMYIWDKPENPYDLFTINSPEGLSGVHEVNPTTDWAGIITSEPVSGELELVDDGTLAGVEGCGQLINDLTGKIALISRGNCQFGTKSLNAQEAGAIAVIIYNNVGGIINMSGGDDGGEVTIPVVSVTKETGELFRDYLLDGETVNATFVNNSPEGPEFLDGDFDNGIIAHEYGHGISSRLTGTTCLSGDEQGGEGWSDFFALAMTAKEGDFAEQSRGIGTYVSAEQNDGRGIRSYPYSRDMALNPMTYDNIITESVPHGVGSVWATMLWDLYWNFVDVYGYDNDRYNGTGGNNMVMQLVIDGLKLQPCDAEFTQMRDAIILADQILYEGVNECLIWETFARRGLGFSADAGDVFSRGDGFEAFDNLPQCVKELKIEKHAIFDSKHTENIEYTLNVINHRDDSLANVYIIDTLQSGVSFIASTSTCEAEVDGAVLRFNLGTMYSGESRECVFEVSLDESLYSEVIFEDDMEDGDDNWLSWAEEGEQTQWGLIEDNAHSGDHSWNALNGDVRTVSYLELAPFTVEGENPTLSFWHKYDTEPSFDGGYVSISTDEVNFDEVGSHIIRGAYRGVSQASPPLGGKDSFWGNSDGFINTLVNLESYIGQNITIRFTYVTDEGNANNAYYDGWIIDDVRIIDRYEVKNTACVYADSVNYACDNVENGGTIIYDHYGIGVDEELVDVFAHVFPNPSSDQININLSGSWNRNLSIEMYNVQGKLMSKLNVDSRRIILPVEDFSDGMYFVEISDGENRIVKRITVQH
jgi:uncharacterized repeat protein (TIGR01451 family)